jgi:tRNA A37 threonylcarbamoyladenosine dehydratase
LEKIPEWQKRTALLAGNEVLARIKQASVLVAGLGGVGAYAAEQLCRAGIGRMAIVDGDFIEDSNRNRQLPALTSTVGRKKTRVMAERLRDINPNIEIMEIDEFIKDDRMKEILSAGYDYVVDAIDTLSPKVFLIKLALENGSTVVSSMGSGGKTDPRMVRISDISGTNNCKLARALRKRLHRMGIKSGFKAIFSPEEVSPESVITLNEEKENQKSVVGTISYMPAIFGCMCSAAVLEDFFQK